MNWEKLPNVNFTPISYGRNSPAKAAWDDYVSTGRKSLDWVADKYSRIKCWKVTDSKWDLEKKSIKFTLLVNADMTRDVEVSYDDICKEMNWKSFDILEGISCVPVEMTMDEVSAMFKSKVAKTAASDSKLRKEHPELFEDADASKSSGK